MSPGARRWQLALPSATRDGALSDTLTILRTVYAPAIGGVSTATVLGTFPFKGTKGKSVREGVVLRAVLSADRAAFVQWDRLTPSDVPGPMMRFRAESPNVPAAGTENADVLKNISVVGSPIAIGAPL